MSSLPEKRKESSEEQKRKARRRLLKLGVYSIPIITTIASREAHAGCSPVQPCMPSGGCQPAAAS